MKFFNWIKKRKVATYDMGLSSCLSKEEANLLKQLDVEKLLNINSEERLIIFSKFIGEEKAQWVNTRFEKDLILKNQKEGMLNWAKETEMEGKFRKEIIRKISKLEKALSPNEQDVFLNELIELSLGIGVTEEEAMIIVDLSRKAEEAKKIMENGGSKAEYEKAYNVFQNYVDKLKNE